jgi:predicted Zn finger-like uncharacterized protein
MTATILIGCPKCKAQLRGPAGLAGRKVRCKGCGHSFLAQSGTQKVPASSSRTASEANVVGGAEKKQGGPSAYGLLSDEVAKEQIENYRKGAEQPGGIQSLDGPAGKPPAKAYDLTNISLKPRCPHCAAELPSEDAVICMECGFDRQNRSTIKTKRTIAVTATDKLLWRLPGFLGAVVALGVLAFVAFLWLKPRSAGIDEENLAMMDTVWFRMWGSVFSGFLISFGIKLAYQRLIADPTPPEIEKR